MNPNEIRKIFDYDFWAFERVWECISQISDEQFIEEIDYSTGSIRNIMVHVMSGDRYWISAFQGIAIPGRVTFENFDTPAKTKTKWDEWPNEIREYVNALNQEHLDRTIDWELFSHGLKSTHRRWEILLHLANHGTDHGAQILAILHHHFRVTTVEQDMIIYLAEHH